MSRIVAACGLICSDCPAYTATQANDSAAISRVAEEWASQFKSDVRPEHVWCDGCMTPSERKCHHAGECEIRPCVVRHGLTSCAPCAEFDGCATLAAFLTMVPAARATLEALRGRA